MSQVENGTPELTALRKLNKPGMFLFFDDGRCLDFSKERVKQLADYYWSDPAKLPAEIRQNEDFKTCTVCPYRGKDILCSAMKPLLPFLKELDSFKSYEPLVAVHVDDTGIKHFSETTLQRALQYITNMAIFEYCEDAKDFQRFFKGINPFMDLNSAAVVLFLNVFWLNGGDREKTEKQIHEIAGAIQVTSESCVKRLRVICKSDPFINSYILTHTFASSFIVIEEILEEYFKTAATAPESSRTQA